jgi:hypothetical protein
MTGADASKAPPRVESSTSFTHPAGTDRQAHDGSAGRLPLYRVKAGLREAGAGPRLHPKPIILAGCSALTSTFSQRFTEAICPQFIPVEALASYTPPKSTQFASLPSYI